MPAIFFQAWGARVPTDKYREMLPHTATEEIGHIEMLATAVALFRGCADLEALGGGGTLVRKGDQGSQDAQLEPEVVVLHPALWISRSYLAYRPVGVRALG
jgi:Mn-containing catalase